MKFAADNAETMTLPKPHWALVPSIPELLLLCGHLRAETFGQRQKPVKEGQDARMPGRHAHFLSSNSWNACQPASEPRPVERDMIGR